MRSEAKNYLERRGGDFLFLRLRHSSWRRFSKNAMGTQKSENDPVAEELKASSLYARSLIEASLDPLVTISPQGKITDVNKATEQATGVSREQLIGSDFCDYFTDAQKARQGYQTVLELGKIKNYPLTIRHVSGHTTDVLYNAAVYRNEEGKVQGVFAAARDLSERQEAEKRQHVTNTLAELFARKNSRKEYLDSAVEVVRDWSGCRCVGIRIVDDAGFIPYESSVGFDPDFLQMESRLSLKSDNCFCIRAIKNEPDEHDQLLMTPGGSFCCSDAPAFARALPPANQSRYRGACILKGFQSLAIVPIRYREQLLGVIHLADESRERTSPAKVEFIESLALLIGEAIQRFNAEAELAKYREHLEELVRQRTRKFRQAAEELVRSNQDLEQFAYVASHDLQEPLRAVAGFVGLLRHEYRDRLDGEALEYIDMASDGAQRMQTLIDDLLIYSRVGVKGKSFKAVDANEALREAAANLQRAIEESGASVASDPLPFVHADSTQLVQLLQNLISNAIKFRGQRPPEIHVSAVQTAGDASRLNSKQGAAWLFAVRDNGIGIESQYFERIFLIFQRLHPRTKYPGTGIGLAICKRIVERHGGRIWVESRPGEGSKFYFTIPDKKG